MRLVGTTESGEERMPDSDRFLDNDIDDIVAVLSLWALADARHNCLRLLVVDRDTSVSCRRLGGRRRTGDLRREVPQR